jgi:hypothetical protein
MKRRFKGLGLALIAALTMSVSASAAQAESFISASYPVTISGSQSTTLEFTIAGTRRWKCSTVTFTSPSISTDSSALTVTPYFNNCSMKVPNSESELDVTMSTGSCTFGLLGPVAKKGKVNIECPAGQSILLDLYNGPNVAHTEANRICQFSIGTQSELGSMQYVNVPGGTLTASAELSGAVLKRVSGTTTNCGKTEQFMTVNGNILFKGNGGSTAIWVG